MYYNTHIQEVIVQHELERREAQPGTYNPRFLVPVRATFPFPCTVRIYAGSTSDTNPALLHEYEHEPNDAHWHIIDYTNISHYVSTSNIYWEISITDEVYNNIVMLSYAGMIFSFNLIALTTQWKASFMQDPAYTSSYTRNKLYLEYINSPVLSQKWLREHGLLDDEILERIYTIAEITSTTELNNHRDFMSAWFGTLVEEAFGKPASDFLNEFKAITLSALDPSASSSGSIYMSAFLETASFLTSDTQVQIIDRSNSNTTPTFYSRNAYKMNEFFIIKYQAPRTMKDASSIVDVSAALLRQYFIHLFFDVSLSGTDGGPVLWIPTLKSID